MNASLSTEATADMSAVIEAAENETEAEKVEKDTHCVTDVRTTETVYSLATTQHALYRGLASPSV